MKPEISSEEWKNWDWPTPPHWQELEQMNDFKALSLWDKLGWLEDAQEHVEATRKRRLERGLPVSEREHD